MQSQQQGGWYDQGQMGGGQQQNGQPNQMGGQVGGQMGGQMGGGFAPPPPGPGGAQYQDDDYSNEPPLLQELGINFSDIGTRTVAVMNPWKQLSTQVMDSADLAGPLVFALGLGFALMMTGKVQFGFIYGMLFMGCTMMYIILLLVGQTKSVDFFQVVSIMGYGLLPICGLAAISILISLKGYIGLFSSGIAVAWSTYTAARFFEKALHMEHMRLIIAYPVVLFYSIFVLVAVF